MTDEEKDKVRLFETAYLAYQAEMRLCLRDRNLWFKQCLLGLFGAIKTCVGLILIPMVIFGALGLPTSLGLIFGMLATAIILWVAPDRICVNLFQERAWRAFDDEVDRLRLAANQKAPTRMDA